MKFVSALALLSVLTSSTLAFAPSPAFSSHTKLAMSDNNSGMDLSGNTWKPDSATMGSTDTGDYFPDDYDGSSVEFNEGMMGSQTSGNKASSGPEKPGMESWAQGGTVMGGGLESSDEIPSDMEFVPSSVPDGSLEMNLMAGKELNIEVKPVCMTFEDYFAGFSKDSHPGFAVAPATGRMDRRGGDTSPMTITCDPQGGSGPFEGTLVINLPEDNSKICYKITAKI